MAADLESVLSQRCTAYTKPSHQGIYGTCMIHQLSEALWAYAIHEGAPVPLGFTRGRVHCVLTSMDLRLASHFRATRHVAPVHDMGATSRIYRCHMEALRINYMMSAYAWTFSKAWNWHFAGSSGCKRRDAGTGKGKITTVCKSRRSVRGCIGWRLDICRGGRKCEGHKQQTKNGRHERKGIRPPPPPSFVGPGSLDHERFNSLHLLGQFVVQSCFELGRLLLDLFVQVINLVFNRA